MPFQDYDDRDNAHLHYAGYWGRDSTYQAPNTPDGGSGTLATTNDPNANITFNFPEPAKWIGVYAIKRSRGAKYGICVDCDLLNPQFEDVDGLNPSDNGKNPPELIFERKFDTYGFHVVILRNTYDERGNPTGNSQLAFDRFQIEVPDSPPSIVTVGPSGTSTTPNTIPSAPTTQPPNQSDTQFNSASKVVTGLTFDSLVHGPNTSADGQAPTPISDPLSSQTSTPGNMTDSRETGTSLSTEAIAGASAGGGALLIIVAVFIILCLRRRRRRRESEPEAAQPNDTGESTTEIRRTLGTDTATPYAKYHSGTFAGINGANAGSGAVNVKSQKAAAAAAELASSSSGPNSRGVDTSSASHSQFSNAQPVLSPLRRGMASTRRETDAGPLSVTQGSDIDDSETLPPEYGHWVASPGE